MKTIWAAPLLIAAVAILHPTLVRNRALQFAIGPVVLLSMIGLLSPTLLASLGRDMRLIPSALLLLAR